VLLLRLAVHYGNNVNVRYDITYSVCITATVRSVRFRSYVITQFSMCLCALVSMIAILEYVQHYLFLFTLVLEYEGMCSQQIEASVKVNKQ
jgi:hypothetical protein